MRLEISDWRNVPYAEAWDRLVHAKQVGEEYVNHIILCEHPHVYTLGRSGKEGNMLLSEEQLSAVGASLYHIDRGGDITYHGPGQLVCYPILNLEEFSLGLKEYVHLLPVVWRKLPVYGWMETLHVPVKSVLSVCVVAIMSQCMAWPSMLIPIYAISAISILADL